MISESNDGARLLIDEIDLGPQDLVSQLPLTGYFERLIPGPDRPDYCLGRLDRPLTYTANRKDLTQAGVDVEALPAEIVSWRGRKVTLSISGVVFVSRFVGQTLHAGMRSLPVNLAYVIDPSVFGDTILDFAKVLPVGIGFISDASGFPA